MSAPAPIVTYSPAYTLVPTYECFNRCTYCNFRVDPGQDRWLSLDAAAEILRSPALQNVCEILLLSGEVHPQSARRAAWVQHLHDLGALALSLGFLPHTNAGPLSRAEMAHLKAVNVSMGLMVEQVTPRLLATVHRHAPSKCPAVRLQQLQWAGELQIPFTTGLLVGLGETLAEREATLHVIAQSHAQWGHIQEVILQPYSPGQSEAHQAAPLDAAALIELVAIARQILPADITIQIPPNLLQHHEHLWACLAAGARDLGGISPKDEVNPDYPHPVDTTLAQTLAAGGWQLQPRLPVYPQYDGWLSAELRGVVERWRQRYGAVPCVRQG